MAKVITDEARALVGVEQEPITVEVDNSAIRKFATAVRFPEPPKHLHVDPEYAKTTKWGGIVAPPTFCTSFTWLAGLLDKINASMGKYRVGLNGGNEYELFEPVRPGDVLTAKPKLASVDEKDRDDGGAMLILDLQADFYNQQNKQVLSTKMRLLRIYAPDQVLAEAKA
jgi:acyl dehydratase